MSRAAADPRKSRMWLFCSAKREHRHTYTSTTRRAGKVGRRGLPAAGSARHHRRLPPLLTFQEAETSPTPRAWCTSAESLPRSSRSPAATPRRPSPCTWSVALDARRMIDDVQGRQGLRQAQARGSARRRGSSPASARNFYAFCVRSAEVATPRSKLDKALRHAI